MNDAADFLGWWFDGAPAAGYSLSYQFPGGKFTSEYVVMLGSLAERAAALGEQDAESIWFRTTTLKHRPEDGRGKAVDSLAVPGLWADLDIVGPGHKNTALPATEEEARLVVKRAWLPEPSALLHTGGGLAAYWKFTSPLVLDTPEALAEAQALSSAWADALIAGSPGVKVDNVRDLARVMRMPGTTNRKVASAPAPCRVLSLDRERTFEPAQLQALLDELSAQRVSASAAEGESTPAGPAAGGTHAPGDDRYFTVEQAKAFLRPKLGAFEARTEEGSDRSTVLFKLATQFSHFGPEFWPPEQARDRLLQAARGNGFAGARGEPHTLTQIDNGLKGDPGDPWKATLVQADAGGGGKLFDMSAPGPAKPQNLPEAFWASRPALAHIRQAAHARRRSADVVLCCVLARLASMLSHEVRLDAGLGPASANLFVAVLGPSGRGKGTGIGIASDLVAPPAYLADLGAAEPSAIKADAWLPAGTVRYWDGVPLGSGEGLAEMFMGPLRLKTAELDKSGEAKWKDARGQIRHNAFVVVDEGQTLTAQNGRKGATVGPTLRTAWVGEVLGQMNAQAETTRLVRRHSYSLGLVIGYQFSAAQALLAETDLGTPQRFLWASVADPAIPELRPAFPGPLSVDLTWHENAVLGLARTKTIEYAPEISAELDARELRRGRGEDTGEDPLSSHETLALMKVSALLAVLDGRWSVSTEDWRLAKDVWTMSCAVRDGLLEHGRAEERKVAEARTNGYVERSVLVQEALDDRQDARIVRVAKSLARKVHKTGQEGATHGAARQFLRSADRRLFDDAADYAVGQRWIANDGDRLTPGTSSPAED